MIMYHGTNCKDIILKEGFVSHYGRFGKAVYCTLSKDDAYNFGNQIINVSINKKYIKTLDYQTLAKQYNVSIEEQEGIPRLEDYVLQNNIKAVRIQYDTDDEEFVIYDLSVLKV